MSEVSEIRQCRISGSPNLITVLSLGEQHLTGVFPKSPQEKVTKGPLDLVWCPDSGLLQLKQTYPVDEMYGENYGYRSGLNNSMVEHLAQKAGFLETFVNLNERDTVIDIGSNDGTLLKSYSRSAKKIGIDPTGSKFASFYPQEICLIPDFFSASLLADALGGKKARLITSIAMFYDLDSPRDFVMNIHECLADDGVWHFEQSYIPSMLRTNSYDTICHEHLEFYSFRVVKELLQGCGMVILDVQMNSVNGGSFAVTAAKKGTHYRINQPVVDWMLSQEDHLKLDTPRPYRDFEERVFHHRGNLLRLVESLVNDGKKIVGYGASTKGNVLLQFCGLTANHISCIADVNADKHGSFTPGTGIPIVSEAEAQKMKPDYYLVLPWHFRDAILRREKKFRADGGKFIFPLPEIEII